MDINSYSTWLEIDLNAIRNNVAKIKDLTGVEVMAVIKANGYGHGARPAAQAAVQGGATWCGVARIEEALALRRAGISCRLLVLGYTPPSKIPEAIDQQITVSLFDPELTHSYLEFARINGGILKAHVKVETGMGRLGMLPEDVPDFLKSLRGGPIHVEGIFTHFAQADEPQSDYTRRQISIFNRLLDELRSADLKPQIVHAANSAAVINFPEAWYDLVRPGDAIFGMAPSPQTPLGSDFRPALAWKARLISVRTYPKGSGISYGSRYVTSGNERIGVMPIGYGDGYRRIDNQQVLVGGKRVNVVGRVCMDQCMLQLDEVPEAKVGDEVVLIGSQGDETISVDEVAARWSTINYEVVCGLADRLPRIYLE
ncbi:MAG TPA: alanine racemase [Anaerolineaceae bacterium]|nr:alanine racemase [Anaerolineaceae bacterium]HOE34283.1 alanine racemase [Anaerolineaceae bacterium]HOT25877.1 alanine racemase [Anaerolineaceae bacterium]HQH58026.1 alanine racemase [Anaerolineaceae bacterium]HQK04074.1 alanine racemase [Anaerolineaceae bacterium]